MGWNWVRGREFSAPGLNMAHYKCVHVHSAGDVGGSRVAQGLLVGGLLGVGGCPSQYFLKKLYISKTPRRGAGGTGYPGGWAAWGHGMWAAGGWDTRPPVGGGGGVE